LWALAGVVAQAQPVGPAETATTAAIARVEVLNPKVNAVIALDPTALDQARALDRQKKVRGPLFGLPVLIKDNIDTKGPLPTTATVLPLRRWGGSGTIQLRSQPMSTIARSILLIVTGSSLQANTQVCSHGAGQV
jgi:hypothetical protein